MPVGRSAGALGGLPVGHGTPRGQGVQDAPIRTAEVEAAARAALAGVWADAEVRVIRLSGEAEAASPARVRFRDEAPRGRVSAEVETTDGAGAWVPAGWAFLDVAVFETVPVVTRDLGRGDALDGAVELQRADVTNLSDAPVADWSGGTASRPIRAGAVLTERLALAPAAAERGEAVRVRYRRGAVALVLDCEARERGAVGETVRVSCDTPRAAYRVRLTAAGEGEWVTTL